MFLKRVMINNYRCLQNVSLDFEDSTILIGENNSGKTACLDIIKDILGKTSANVYFNEYDYYVDEDVKNPQESAGISVTFIFRERTENEWEEDLVSKYVNVIQPYQDDISGLNLMQIALRVTSKYNIASEQFEATYTFINQADEPLQLKVQSLMSDFLKLNPVFYLQALRDSAEIFSGKSFMWGRFLKQVKFKPDDLKTLQESIETLNIEIISKDESLRQLVGSMNNIEKVLDFAKESSVAVNALPVKSWDLLSKAQITLKNKEKLVLPLDRYGQGTQSMSVILLYEAYINILLKKIYNKYSQAILTLEEPETHLHPQAIRAFEKQLQKIEVQKIITTHSPYFVQNVDICQIRLFRRRDGKTEILFIPRTVSVFLEDIPYVVGKIVESFSETLEIKNKTLIAKKFIEECPARSLFGYYSKKEPAKLAIVESFIRQSRFLFSMEEVCQLNSFVQKSRGEIFFAKGWLMAEGQTESVLLPYFAKVLECDLDENGISYIDYRSNGSAKAFTKLAAVLNFEWTLLADNDDQGASSITEIRNNGFSESEITDRVRVTNGNDIECELINSGFLNDYEIILGEELTENIIALKESGDIEGYKAQIVGLVQSGKGKVRNAYKLVNQLESRNMPASEIPETIKYIIERLCKDGR